MNFSKITFAILIMCTALSQAQEKELINLEGAIAYALENQADAKKAELQIENTKYQIQEARSGALPHITAQGGITYMPIGMEMAIPSEDFPGGEENPEPYMFLEFGQNWSASGGVMLMQNIFDKSVFTGLKAAKTTREFYQINAELTEEQIIERVAKAYYEVFVQKEQLKTIDSSYAMISKSKNIIKNLFENGMAREIDLDRIKVQLTNLSSSRQQLVNAVQLTENALKFYMGMPIENPIALVEEEFEVQSYLPENNADIKERTELKVLEKQKELLGLQKEAKKAAYYPTLSLMGFYNYMGQGDRFPIGSGLKQGVYWSDFAMIGLNLQIPIFSGFMNKARVNQADIELRTLETEMENTELALDLEYSNAKSQIENSMISLDNQQENVDLAQKVVDNIENNYRLGLANLTDLLEAQNALVEAKNNYSNTVLEYKLAEVQLLKAKGELYKLK